MMPRSSLGGAVAATALVLAIAVSAAQQPGGPTGGERGRRGTLTPGERRSSADGPLDGNLRYDGRFTFVRLRYEPGAGGSYYQREPPWSHDYPRADRNFMKILNEVSYLGPHTDGSNVLSLGDPELFKYPLAYLCEPGFWTLGNNDAEALRTYLLKGGFLIFDDFRGRDWENFETQIRRVLPQGRFVPLDASHPIFHSFFEIDSLDFIQFYDRAQPYFYGMFEDNDPKKRMLMIVNFNNDISEYWEWSDTGLMPVDRSNEAYKLGVNYVVYGMTH